MAGRVLAAGGAADARVVPISARHSSLRALSSVKAVMVTASTELLWMSSMKWKSPPGSGRVIGKAALFSVTAGRSSVTVTVSLSDAEASLSSLSITVIDAVLE